jgi:hypothetical protein
VSCFNIADAYLEGHKGRAAAQVHISPPLQPMSVHVTAARAARKLRMTRTAGTAARVQLLICMSELLQQPAVDAAACASCIWLHTRVKPIDPTHKHG